MLQKNKVLEIKVGAALSLLNLEWLRPHPLRASKLSAYSAVIVQRADHRPVIGCNNLELMISGWKSSALDIRRPIDRRVP
jgi:hypothetical protein